MAIKGTDLLLVMEIATTIRCGIFAFQRIAFMGAYLVWYMLPHAILHSLSYESDLSTLSTEEHIDRISAGIGALYNNTMAIGEKLPQIFLEIFIETAKSFTHGVHVGA